MSICVSNHQCGEVEFKYRPVYYRLSTDVHATYILGVLYLMCGCFLAHIMYILGKARDTLLTDLKNDITDFV